MERKTVVRRHKIDARIRQPAVVAVEIARSGQTKAERADLPAVALPETSRGIAIGRVPFRPQHGKVADLVAARAEIPWLGNELHSRNNRVLLDDVEERAKTVDVVELTRQSGGQIEAKPVDVHLGDPITQAVHDQLQNPRMSHVERIAAAR